MTTRQRIAKMTIFMVAAILAVAAFAVVSYAQGDCRNPVFVETVSPDANVLIIFDNSGSMNEAMYHPAYNPGITYSGSFTHDDTYYVSSDGTRTPRSFKSSWPNTPSAYLVDSDQGEDGRYLGNYLNWIFFNATAEERAAIPTITRIQVSKAVVTDLIDRTYGVLFGVMQFTYDNGGQWVGKIGTAKSTLMSAVANVDANTWTPIAETLVTALNYFKDSTNGPIQASCQHNFIILVTDGLPTMDLNVPSSLRDYDGDHLDPGTCASIGAPYPNDNDCSHSMDDVAKYLFDTDMRTDMSKKQNVITYAIGFTINAPLLQAAATKGGGLYFTADNSDELIVALNSVINDIISKKSSGTATSVVATENKTVNRLYRAKFMPGSWIGFLEAFDLPYDEGEAAVWKADETLKNRDPDARTIYTSINGTSKIPFDVSQSSNLRPYLNATTSDSANHIIQYVRGADVAGCRDRENWKLGDIVDSSPISVGAPAHFYDFNDYSDFKQAHANRDEVIYLGANDGMIHCFRTEDGSEKWAYIPKNQLGKLRELMDPSYCHDFFVNLTPKVTDAFVNGSWKTILICGQKEGGDGYTALDVTSPEPGSVSVLWDTTVPIVKESWSVPCIVRDRHLDKFIMVVGSGPDSTTHRAYAAAVDLANGSTLWTDLLSTSSGINMANSAQAIDTDFDGYDDFVYLTDLSGHLWRYDLSTNPWSKQLLFQTSQPIQTSPALSIDQAGRVVVAFGTGRYLVFNDISSTSLQSFYCVFDDRSATTVTLSNLENQTSTFHGLTGTDRGWYVNLVNQQGERVTKNCAIAAGTVYFTSFRPETGVCMAGGVSWLYTMDVFDGSAPDNEDQTENDSTQDRSKSLGEGIYNDPIIDIVNEKIVLQSTDTTLDMEDVQGNLQKVLVRSWRQLYQ